MEQQEALTEPLLSVEQAAQRLGVEVRFVRRLVAERRIRFYHVGKYVKFDPADLRAFVLAGKVEPVVLRRTWRNGTVAYA